MKKLFLLLFSFLALINTLTSASPDDSLKYSATDVEKLKKLIKADTAIKYKTGAITINSDIQLDVPKGYKFMSKKDAEYVVFDLWGNPRTDDILGMVVKEDYSTLQFDAWAFVMSYENSGFVKDEDAADINYDELMKEIQKGEEESNKQRQEGGYPTMHIIGWASTPFYDKEHNILHWAKSIAFGNNNDTTLNYDVRILGRKGILSLNAVGDFSKLQDIKLHIPDIINIAQFKKGNKYLDFDPKYDKVAAYTIGGLIAGKLLAKAGILVLLVKNIKLILLAIAAIFGRFGKKILSFFRRKREEEFIEPVTEPLQANNDETKQIQ